MSPRMKELLNRPGLERLNDWASIGPVQRAALEEFTELVVRDCAGYLPDPDLIAIAVLKEREECAKLCDKQANDKNESDPWTGCASYLADEIRARKKTMRTMDALRECRGAIKEHLLRPTDAELERLTGEPHIDGYPLYSLLPPPAKEKP